MSQDANMEVGGRIAMGPLLGGLSGQDIIGTVTSVSPGRVEVVLTYFGVRIGKAFRVTDEGGVTWAME